MKTGLFGGDWEDFIQPVNEYFDNAINQIQSQGAHGELARMQAMDDALGTGASSGAGGSGGATLGLSNLGLTLPPGSGDSRLREAGLHLGGDGLSGLGGSPNIPPLGQPGPQSAAGLGNSISQNPVNLQDAVPPDTSRYVARSEAGAKGPGWSLFGYPSAQEAAVAAEKHYNPISVSDNTERTGTVIGIPILGYTYLGPTLNGPAGDTNAPACIGCSAYYHTHAGNDIRYDGENFSPADRGLAQVPAGGISGPVPIYLGTPSGAIKVYNPITGYEGPPK